MGLYIDISFQVNGEKFELLTKHLLRLPPFSLKRDFGKLTKHPRKRFPKFPLVVRVIDRSDPNQPITATSVTFRPSLRHASGL